MNIISVHLGRYDLHTATPVNQSMYIDKSKSLQNAAHHAAYPNSPALG